MATAFAGVLAFLLVSPPSAAAQDEPERVAIGSNLVIGEGEVVQGGVSVTNGNLTVLGEVRGNVAVVNGEVTIKGKVTGDVAVTYGALTLSPDCEVGGNVLTIMSTVQRDSSAMIAGKVMKFDNPLVSMNNMVARQPERGPHSHGAFNRFVGLFAWSMFSLLVLGLSLGLAFLAPQRVLISSATLEVQTGPSVVVGAITALLLGPTTAVTVMLLIASGIGVVLVPLVALAAAALLISGLVVVSVWLGKRVYETARPGPEQAPAPLLLQVLLGMAVILSSTVVPSALVPGWMSGLLMPLLYFVACLGLGSAILSRLGTLQPPSSVRNLPPAY